MILRSRAAAGDATPYRRDIKVWLSHWNELAHILRLGDGASVQERRTPPVGGHEIPSFTHRYAQPMEVRRLISI
jgi:hypothetical protein